MAPIGRLSTSGVRSPTVPQVRRTTDQEAAIVETTTSTHSETRTDEPVDGDPATNELVVEELLVEEVSIDGMCGVY